MYFYDEMSIFCRNINNKLVNNVIWLKRITQTVYRMSSIDFVHYVLKARHVKRFGVRKGRRSENINM